MTSDRGAFLALTVLYKMAPSRSPTLQSLARWLRSGADIRCVVWDNSPDKVDDAEAAWLLENLPGAEYRHTPENVALSRIYNTIIRDYLRRDHSVRFAVLLLFDQDSSFGPDLLDEAANTMATHPEVSLFLPHVVVGNAIVSPANMYGCIGSRWRSKRVGIMRARFHTAINSGMIVRSEYLTSRFSGYDERLRFYGTDNDFCRKYATSERWMYVLESEVKHSLSRDVDEPRDVRLWRHRENVRALILTNATGWSTRLLTAFYCRLYCLKRAIIERDPRFLIWDDAVRSRFEE